MGTDDKAKNKAQELKRAGQGGGRPGHRRQAAAGRGAGRPGQGRPQAGRREGQGRLPAL